MAPAQAFHAWCPVIVVLLALGGCAESPGLASTPVDWWHGLEGGRIAEARPPPPNADAPYPTLGVVPKKPAAPDAATHARIASGLTADQRNAQFAAAQAPIPVVPKPAAHPPPPAAKPDDDSQMNASMAAADAPPPPAAPAPPKPRAATPATPVAAGDAAMPAIPDAPPPAPRIGGVSVPAVTAPTPPKPAPPPVPQVPKLVDGKAVAIAFAEGSAILSADALPPLKQLAKQRGAANVAVVGFGEAGSSDPDAQQAALPLALDRARAIASSLIANGVPAPAIRIAAEPQGTGAAARLVN